MERSLQNSVMDQMAGARAPGAASPSRGTGNIPYAKGMQSGNFGPQPQRGGAPDHPPMAASPSGPPPQGSGPPPGMGGSPSGPPPPGPGQANPYLDPMFYFDVMAAIMSALVGAAEQDEGMY
jgi:hypothetical protein